LSKINDIQLNNIQVNGLHSNKNEVLALITTISLDSVETFGVSCLALALGVFLAKRVSFLHRYNLPSSVVGGLSLCLLLLSLRKLQLVEISFTKSFADPLMYTFFASIGFAASIDTLKKGGIAALTFLAACSIFTVFQNVLGVAIASVFDLHPLFGVLTGSVALAGGPGTALAFAKDFEAVGVQGAEVAAISAALSGIMIGGITGTPLATRLISKLKTNDLSSVKPMAKKPNLSGSIAISDDSGLDSCEQTDDQDSLVPKNLASELLRHVIILGLVLWAGLYISRGLDSIGMKLPGYIGAMIAAAILRNFGNRTPALKIHMGIMDDLGSISLALFLSMALVSLEIWKIADVALPLVVILIAQTAAVLAGAYWVIFKWSGRNYDAAVISAGFVGFMMGTTANAMTNMRALADRYGFSAKAFLIVPIVGACFIDFVNATIINIFLNIFR
jgi:ESS family glutamate:Na+ symporter